ncbi:UNVERIFIED_CONTAM: hypothetical protein Sradi_5437500 [Sesamum radiatum]|uniref:Lunapark zinc ribbon domain-containing protein n=1 Tax=Sesamum radiatum TaxID=300843 RepID=A0AAW2LBM8_SESRA
MAEESKNDVAESIKSTNTEIKRTAKKKGVLSGLWSALFGAHGDDFEKRLQHISKEEAVILARITRRSRKYRKRTRHLITFSVIFEVIAVGYAIITTRLIDLNWKMRASRVSPMFLLPALSYITYSVLRSFSKMCDQKDHKTLEKLQAERQAKINELKERTNYYTTQQLIQARWPASSQAAAARVLASKLGADSGLKLYVADDSNLSDLTGKSNDVQVARTTGLRQRRASHSRTNSIESESILYAEEEMLNNVGDEDASVSQQHPLVIEHQPQTGLSSNNGGWIARLAALLVGEDPTQSYALICRNCHMHNGLARKEDFPYITYYCPHCNALNGLNQPEDRIFASNSSTMTSLQTLEGAEGVPVNKVCGPGGMTGDNQVSLNSSHVATTVGSSES